MIHHAAYGGVYDYYLERAERQGDVIEGSLICVEYNRQCAATMITAFIPARTTDDPIRLVNTIANVLEEEHRILPDAQGHISVAIYPIDDAVLDMVIRRRTVH